MEDENNYVDYKVKYPRIKRLIMIIVAMWVIFWALSFVFCPPARAGVKAEIKINSIMKVSKEKKDNVIFFGELPNLYAIPEGYEVAAVGEFKTSAVTMKCNFDVLMQLSKEKCKELNYEGYALAELKQPSVLNTCYQSKVIFLIALKR